MTTRSKSKAPAPPSSSRSAAASSLVCNTVSAQVEALTTEFHRLFSALCRSKADLVVLTDPGSFEFKSAIMDFLDKIVRSLVLPALLLYLIPSGRTNLTMSSIACVVSLKRPGPSTIRRSLLGSKSCFAFLLPPTNASPGPFLYSIIALPIS
jgi:hypothetical protein